MNMECRQDEHRPELTGDASWIFRLLAFTVHGIALDLQLTYNVNKVKRHSATSGQRCDLEEP
jgi:hypothetical protein